MSNFPGTVDEDRISVFASPDDLSSAGKAMRARVERASHAQWKPDTSRLDPIEILRAADEQRLPNLVPIRYGRMLRSPFAFYRGTAGVMAADLAKTPTSGIRVQSCGDCHLSNFGGFATPERNIVFDINDFDETLPAPWEWDVKRLVSSFVLAVRNNNLSDEVARETALACVENYRQAMRRFSQLSPLELWYQRIGSGDFLEIIDNAKIRNQVAQNIKKQTAKHGHDAAYPKLAQVIAGEIRIRDNPPLIFHPEESRAPDFVPLVTQMMKEYRETLPDDRRVLFDRYRFVDAAIKVVGVGSVGTRCWVALLMSPSNSPLFLQFKQANRSVFEPYAGKSAYDHQGQRVVMGQRLMQAASDIFLGWVTGPNAEFYVRQLRDAKISPLIETFDESMFHAYANACGQNLARAHAKTGNAWTIAGYLGKNDEFDEAIADFAFAYADQAEKDYDALKEAVRTGRVDAYVE